MKNCGIIEGFFGTPWSWQVRAAYAEFLKDNGYHFYIYAPKADSCLRKKWQCSWPRETAEHLVNLQAEFHTRNLQFGIGWSPFEAYLGDQVTVSAQLSSKVRELNALGCDILCILFDDMYGAIANLAELQINIVNKIADTTTAKKLIVCPTYYSFDPILDNVFGQRPQDYLTTLGSRLDSDIDIFWTGSKVISDSYSSQHISEVADILQRPPFLWDNGLANDGAKSSLFLHLNGFSDRARVVNENISGLAINPMNQAHLSQIALKSLTESTRADIDQQGTDSLFDRVCRTLCGEQLASLISEDLAPFQVKGLDNLEHDGELNHLIEKYKNYLHNPCAREIYDWLNGKYRFDPNCLTE